MSVLASLQMHAVVTVTCVFVLILLHMFACVYVLMHVRVCVLFLLKCASVCACLCIDYWLCFVLLLLMCASMCD